MTTNKKIEELTRKMHEMAKELLVQAKEAGMADGYAHIAVGPDDNYIRVDVNNKEGYYEICTIGENEKPRLSFKEA